MDGQVIVVGASLAGWRTAEALRREGHRGRITLVGAEPQLPYDRPPLSKQFLTDEWEEAKLALARDGVESVGAEWRLGEAAVSLDVATRAVRLANGERLEGADVVVIATGARARRLPFGHDLEGVLELRTQADALALRRAMATASRVVVVGAGFIGMELAASCRTRGLEVDVVDPLPAPLVRGLGPVLGERVAERHRREGVRFHLETGVEGFEGEDRVRAVRLTDGRRLPADVVLELSGTGYTAQLHDDNQVSIDRGGEQRAWMVTSEAATFSLARARCLANGPSYPQAMAEGGETFRLRVRDGDGIATYVEVSTDARAPEGQYERARDLEEALKAAEAIGDDTLQGRGGGTVRPETFSHGTSAQRARWFRIGFDTGDPKACDTFNAARL